MPVKTAMKQIKVPELHPNRLLRRLFPLLASDWVTILVEAWRFVARFLGRELYPGMYEILDYDAVLELKDTKGETAIFRRREKVKFLQHFSLPTNETPDEQYQNMMELAQTL